METSGREETTVRYVPWAVETAMTPVRDGGKRAGQVRDPEAQSLMSYRIAWNMSYGECWAATSKGSSIDRLVRLTNEKRSPLSNRSNCDH